jgi:hypothetical protein
MGDHIVRRGPPTRPPQPRERRPTAEIPEQQLLELIRNPTTEELEAELELVDGVPRLFPDATPDSLPRVGSPRFAHTLRRGMQPVALPSRRPPPPPPPRAATTRPDKRPASSAAAMPRQPMRAGDGGRSIGRLAIGTPPLPAPALKPAQGTPRLARAPNAMVPTRPARAVEPVAGPAVAPPGPESRTLTAAPPPPPAPMPVEPKVIVASVDMPISAATPELPSVPTAPTVASLPSAPTARRARLVLPVGLVLLVLGTLAVILL